jgi:hypothetical protein
MSRRSLTIGVLVLFFVVLGAAVAHWYLLDGLDGWLFSLGVEEDTNFAAGYSDEAFRALRKGMRSDDVQRLLGPPVSKVGAEGGIDLWRYSWSPSNSTYRERDVFFRDGSVIRIESGMYLD